MAENQELRKYKTLKLKNNMEEWYYHAYQTTTRQPS